MTIKKLLLETPTDNISLNLRGVTKAVVDSIKEIHKGIRVVWFCISSVTGQTVRNVSIFSDKNLERAFIKRVCGESGMYEISVRSRNYTPFKFTLMLDDEPKLTPDKREAVKHMRENLTTCFGVYSPKYGFAEQVFVENDCLVLRWVVSEECDEVIVEISPYELLHAKIDVNTNLITIHRTIAKYDDSADPTLELMALKPFMP